MAMNLTVDIVTKYDQSLQGAAKVTDSYKKLGKQLVETSQEGKAADEAQKKYIASLNAALLGLENETNALAASRAQIKLLTQERGKMSSALGANAELTKKLSNAIQEETKNLQQLEAAAKKASKSGMGELEKSSGNAATKLLSVAKNILKFQLLMGPITSVVRGFRNTVSDSIKVAAEAEQVFNKLSTVFYGLEDSATAAANAISSKLGVATSTAASALSTVGDLLQAQGMGTSASLSTATNWVSQFQDIIAFKDINMSLEEFAQTFMSGAAGNLRNFRTFGSIVKESAVNAELAKKGLDKLTGSELELAKMTTRATLALDQQANAMGATEREWESALSVNRRLSEAWKEYKENLGASINEVLKPAKSWLTTILDYANDVTRAIKEINGGEFTIKVRQDGTVVADSLIMKALDVAVLNPKLTHGGTDRTSSDVIANAMKKNARTTSGATKITYSADELAAVMKATGATSEEMKAAIQAAIEGGKNIAEISDETWVAANASVRAYWELQDAITDAKNAILSSAEGFDNFTESLASLAHISVRSTNLAAIGEGVNEYNYEDLLQSFGQTASNQTNTVLQSVLRQFRGFSTGTFTSDFNKAFGTGSAADAYKDWMTEIESLYTILYNREVQFGDVGQAVLDDVIDMWGLVNKQLDDYNAGLQEAANKEAALKTAQSVASDYRTQLNNYGKSSYDVTYNGLLAKRDSALTGAEANLYEDAARDFKTLTAKELIDSFSGIAYAAEMATIGMTENEKALYELEQQYLEAAKSEALTAEDQDKLKKNYEDQRDALIALQKAQNAYNLQLEREAAMKAAQATYASGGPGTTWQTKLAQYGMSERDLLVQQRDAASAKHDPMWVAYQKEIDALDKFTKKTEEAAKAAAELAAWKALGNRALGSTGTMGQIYQAFQGDGDIWTKILNAILTILENTEGWERVAALLDQVFKAFEPVIDAIVDVIAALPWDIIIFCVKIIASAIVVILKTVEYIVNMFVWLWDNLKAAIHNIIEFIKHPVNARKRDTWEYRSWENLQQTLDETAQKEYEILERIWNTSNEIAENTSKDDLSLLRDLYARNIINEDQFYAGARVVQKNMVFDPVAATSPNYISASQPSMSSVSYGGVTIQFSGTNTEEMKRWITDFFNRNGLSYNMEIGG